MKILAIRGATTISDNCAEEISAKTLQLINEILSSNALCEGNELDKSTIVSCIFSSTADIDAYYPATAVTKSGILKNVPLFSALEPPIKNSLPLCIRVLMTIATNQDFSPKHIYLGAAKELKPNF